MIEQDTQVTGERWLGWLKKINEQVTALHLHREVWQRITQIAETSRVVRQQPFFVHWLTDLYVATQVVGIRRLADRDSRTVSFWRLLTAIKENPEILSRRAFLAKYPPGPAQAFGDRDFDKFASPGDPYVDPDLVAADLATLERTDQAVQRITRYVNKHVAHLDEQPGPLPDLTFGELNDAIDVLGRLLQRYTLLLEAASIHPIAPVLQFDWEAVFREPWVRGVQEASDGAPGSCGSAEGGLSV